MSQDEAAALLPENSSTVLQYSVYDRSIEHLSLGDHSNSNRHVAFHAIGYEVVQNRCQKLLPKVILHNVRYAMMILLLMMYVMFSVSNV